VTAANNGEGKQVSCRLSGHRRERFSSDGLSLRAGTGKFLAGSCVPLIRHSNQLELGNQMGN
jgi:hypothetical protein